MAAAGIDSADHVKVKHFKLCQYSSRFSEALFSEKFQLVLNAGSCLTG